MGSRSTYHIASASTYNNVASQQREWMDGFFAGWHGNVKHVKGEEGEVPCRGFVCDN